VLIGRDFMVRGHGERCKAPELLFASFSHYRLSWALGLRVHLIFLPVTSCSRLCPKSRCMDTAQGRSWDVAVPSLEAQRWPPTYA
jgi:hypothetical protein